MTSQQSFPRQKSTPACIRWLWWILFAGIALACLPFLARLVIEVIDIQYTMNAIWNLKIVSRSLLEYQQKNGDFPVVPTMDELLLTLNIQESELKPSNPSLCQFQYCPSVTPDKPYLCYWESNEKWGVFRFFRSKHQRHQLLLLWKDGSVFCSPKNIDYALEFKKDEIDRSNNRSRIHSE